MAALLSAFTRWARRWTDLLKPAHVFPLMIHITLESSSQHQSEAAYLSTAVVLKAKRVLQAPVGASAGGLTHPLGSELARYLKTRHTSAVRGLCLRSCSPIMSCNAAPKQYSIIQLGQIIAQHVEQ